MKYNREQLFLWSLRIGLAATYLYSGTGLLFEPGNWIGYLPAWFKDILPIAPEIYLQIQGSIELLFIVSFISGVFIYWAALFSVIEMLSILILIGINVATFRDFAVLGSALALFFYYYEKKE